MAFYGCFEFEEVPLIVDGKRLGMFAGEADVNEHGVLLRIRLEPDKLKLERRAALTDPTLKVLWLGLADSVRSAVENQWQEWCCHYLKEEAEAARADQIIDQWKHEAA